MQFRMYNCTRHNLNIKSQLKLHLMNKYQLRAGIIYSADTSTYGPMINYRCVHIPLHHLVELRVNHIYGSLKYALFAEMAAMLKVFPLRSTAFLLI